VHQWVSGVEWYWRSPECDVSTLCTTPAKGMHPGHTVNIIHSFNPLSMNLNLRHPQAKGIKYTINIVYLIPLLRLSTCVSEDPKSIRARLSWQLQPKNSF
jgi:hypothetical protein